MKIINDYLEKLGATNITYKHIKDTYITKVRYRIGKENKTLEIDWWELDIKVFKVKEDYRDRFTDYKKETDEACKIVDDKYRPVFEEYKKDIAEVTEKEILNQLNKQIWL